MEKQGENANIGDVFCLKFENELPDNFNKKSPLPYDNELFANNLTIRLLECDSVKLNFNVKSKPKPKPEPKLYYIEEWDCSLKITELKVKFTSKNIYDLLRIYGNNSTIINFLNTKNIDYFGVLNIALNDKNIDVIKILFNNELITQKLQYNRFTDKMVYNILTIFENNNKDYNDIVNILISNDFNFCYVFMFLLVQNDTNIAKTLLENNHFLTKIISDFNLYGIRFDNQITYYILKIFSSNPKILDYLISNQADLLGALHEAIDYNNISYMEQNYNIVKSILETGINVNLLNKNYTAITVACINNNINIVKLLLANGADIYVKDGWNKNTIDYYNYNYIKGHEIFQIIQNWNKISLLYTLSKLENYSGIFFNINEIIDFI